VKVSFNSPTTFSIAIPVGALAVLALDGALPAPWSIVAAAVALTVGVAVPVAGQSTFYSNFVIADFFATQYVTFAPRYYHVDKPYMVKEAGGEYRIPFMILQPFRILIQRLHLLQPLPSTYFFTSLYTSRPTSSMLLSTPFSAPLILTTLTPLASALSSIVSNASFTFLSLSNVS
jgi:hypothetical protein